MAQQELFDGDVITTINDNENIAVQEPDPATAGSKVISWANFKLLLRTLFVWLGNVDQAIDGIKTFLKSPIVPDPTTELQAVNLRTLNSKTSNPDYIDYTPQGSAPAELFGRTYLNDLNKAYERYTEISGLSPIRDGRVLRSRVLNNTGNTIVRGTLCKITGIAGTSPIVEPSDNSIIDDVKIIVGITMHDILDGEHGYLAVFETVIGVDTSGMTVNQLIYADPENIGGFTNIEPQPPYPSYPVGFVSIVAPNGVVGIRVGGFSGSDTSINLKGVLNGIITQTPNVVITSNGTTITATVSNEEQPEDDVPFILNDKRYLLPKNSSVTVPPGADSNTLQTSIIYAYLNVDVPTLAIATTAPSIPYATICELAVFDAIRTQSDGRPFAYRRANNAIDSKNGVNDGALGLSVRTVSAIRKKLGSNWISGQDGSPTVTNVNISIALTAGRAMQFNEASTPEFLGAPYIIYNNISNNVTYQEVVNLTSITTDASGGTLLSNNTFYTIRLFYLFNSNGVGNSVIATRPLGKYTTAAEAIQDPLNYTVNVNDTKIEEIVYPLYDLVIGRTGSGGTTISLVQLTDRRTKLLGGAGGGGAAGGGGTDDKVRISAADTTNDYLDPKVTVGDEFTKEIVNPAANESLLIKFKGWIYNTTRTFKAIFNIESLTADRTYTWPDKDGTVAMTSDIGGGGGHIISENDVDFTARTNLNFVTANGETVVSDDAIKEATDITQKLRALNDYDATGEQAGNLIQRNIGNTGFESVQSSNLPITRQPFANITASGQIAGALHYAESKILIISYESDTAITFSLGHSSGTTEIVNGASLSVGKGELVLNVPYNETTNDKDVYATLSAAATVSIKITQLKGV